MASWLAAPWKEKLTALKDDLERALARWFRRRREASATELEPVAPGWVGSFGWPAIEVEDQPDRIVVTAELPGLEAKDFQVELSGEALILRGEKRREREERGDDFVYSECAYGAFMRYIPLPVPVVAEKAQARFRSGRLIVELPKQTPAKRIPLSVS